MKGRRKIAYLLCIVFLVSYFPLRTGAMDRVYDTQTESIDLDGDAGTTTVQADGFTEQTERTQDKEEQSLTEISSAQSETVNDTTSEKTEDTDRKEDKTKQTDVQTTKETQKKKTKTQKSSTENKNGIAMYSNEINGNKNLKEPEKVGKGTYAPMNNLQILDNMEGASAKIIDHGTGIDQDENRYYQIKDISADTEGDDKEDSVDKSISQGNFWNNDSNDGYGIWNSMYKSMRGETHYGGIAILFAPSSDQYVYGSYGYDGYKWEYEEGWKQADRSLKTTTMYFTVKYQHVGYYKGRMINAKALIKITPSKNRNKDAPWDDNDYGYQGSYQPMVQISNSLYRGWVWQNVKEFHVDLSFQYSDDTEQKDIQLVAAANEKDQNYSAMDATYYVINSLNPTIDTTSWEKYPHYTGPEYVLPTQTNGISSAYIVDNYNINGKSYASNIQTSYTVGQNTAYAYNGGTNEWASENDAIGADGFAENSVMIMPNKCTDLSFTLGQLDREPYDEGVRNSKKHSSSMWSSISTTPFSTERQPIHIDYTKEWKGITPEERDAIETLTVELYLEGTVAATGEAYQELLRTDTIKQRNGKWNGTFHSLALLDSAEDSQGATITNKRYVIKETQIVMKDKTVIDLTSNPNVYQTSYAYLDANGTEQKGNSMSQTTLKDNTKGSDGSYNIKESFLIYNEVIKKGSIKIQKVDDEKKGINGVTFRLYRAVVNGDVWTEDSAKPTIDLTTETVNGEDGICQFTGLEEGNYLVKEIKTKKGYVLLKDPVKITLPYDLNGTKKYDLTYTVTNGQSFDLPQTGTNVRYDQFLKSGVAILMIASGMLFLRRRRRC